ncbi:MAG TPA: hypothetical protein DDY49_10280 [Paenibacillaceae bacterium]|nr:hypothetical protein [Paenibacillaceae bacterium]
MRKMVLFFIMFSLLMLSVTGCSLLQRPNTVADQFLLSLKNNEFDKLAPLVYTKEGTKSEIKTTPEALNTEEGKIIKALLSKISFEPAKTESKEGDSAVVSVKITTVDTNVLYAKLMQEVMPLAFASAFAGEEEQKEIEKMMPSLMLKNINDPNVTMTTKDIKMNLKKIDGKYKVVMDDQLFKDLFGELGSK